MTPAQQKLADAIWNELEGIEHLQIGMRHALDRVDLLRSVATGWRKLRGSDTIPDELLDLVRQSWTRPPEELESRAIRLLAELCADPRRMLGQFDRYQKLNSAVLAQIGQMIENYTDRRHYGPSQPDVAQIRTLARLHLESRASIRYEALRWHLLEFCLREQVDPVWLVAQPGEPLFYPLEAFRGFVGQVEGDASLRFVYWASRAVSG